MIMNSASLLDLRGTALVQGIVQRTIEIITCAYNRLKLEILA